jgi:O-antigen ligase
MLVVAVDLASWAVVPGVAMTPLGLQGMHGQKNMLGMYSMVTILAGLTCALNLKGLARLAILGSCGIAGITLLASRSGTSTGLTLATVVILPALVVALRRRGLVVTAALLGPVLLLVAGLAFYLMWCGLAAVDPWAPLAGVTFTKRTDLWAFLIQNIAKRPWGGAGFGSFWAIDKTVQPSILSGLWFGRGPDDIAPEGHNAYLDLAATTGLIGLALGLFVLIRAIIRAGSAVRAAPAGMALPTAAFHLGYCLMVAGHSSMESTLFAPNSQLGTLFILSAVTLAWARHRAPAPVARLRAARQVPTRRESTVPATRAVPAQR